MGTYAQWVRKKPVAQVAWVTGPEAVLRYDVAAEYARAVPLALQYSVHAGDAHLWDFLLAVPSCARLILVWDAEKLDLHHVPLLLGDSFEGAFTVFIASADDFPRVTADRRMDDRPKSELHPALAALRDSRHGLLVRCVAPKDPEGQAQLVTTWWPGAGRNFGAALLERCAGDLGAARQAALKACFAGLPPTPQSLDITCPPAARTDFADQLVAGNVKAAMAAAARMPPDETGSVLGLLSSRLSVLSVLGDAARKGVNAQEVAVRLKIDQYVVKLLRPHAASYTPSKAARCREVLALAESSWKAGARDGVLEAVAVLW
jgi:hypothetical protein